MTLTVTHENPLTLTKRIFYLAWKASRVAGIGVLQDRREMTEAEVWEGVAGMTDYPKGSAKVVCPEPNTFNADYVFGRMMKLRVETKEVEVVIPDGDYDPRSDYQSWCRTYPTYMNLVDAAVESLKLK